MSLRAERVRAYLPAALPAAGMLVIIACFYGYSALLRGVNRPYIAYDALAAPATATMPVEEFRARLFWGTGSAALVIGLLWNMVLALHVLSTIAREERLGWERTFLWALTVSTVTVCSAAAALRPTSGEVGRLILLSIGRNTGVPVWSYTTFTNALTAIGVSCVASAAIALLLPLDLRASDALIRLRRRVSLAKLVLYSASTLLAIGVFQLWALYTWPASFLAEPAAGRVRYLGNSLSFAASMFFSGWLILIYLPIAVVHQAWVVQSMQALAPQNSGEFDPDQWLKRQGLDTSPLSVLNRSVVILAPIAAAVMTHLLG